VFPIIFIGIVLSILALSHKKYHKETDSLDKKQYPFKRLIPVGLFLLDAAGVKLAGAFSKRFSVKLSQLHGTKELAHYTRIHQANKLVYLIAGLFLISIIAALSKIDTGFFVFSISLIAALIYLSDREIDKALEKRKREIMLYFPDFLNSLTLLVNAGMTVTKAWEKVSVEEDGYNSLGFELKTVISEISSGVSEYRAYENFAKRCRTPEITRAISIILQNMRKGSSEIVPVLRVQANECWEMRKRVAKRLGEEASSKLLFPMMLIFLSILLIVLTPAVLSMKQILN
jgi:tight adherence protein C